MRRVVFFHFIVVLAALASGAAYAQAQISTLEKPSFQERIPQGLLDSDNHFLTLTLENDMFASRSDQNYTHGTRLTYFDVGMKSPDIIAALDGMLPFFTFNETTSVAYSVGQNLYTPDDITARTPNPRASSTQSSGGGVLAAHHQRSALPGTAANGTCR